MVLEKLFELAAPYLERNDFGVEHTRRVFDIARQNFAIPSKIEEFTLSTIILHDIGGSTIREQYQNGPKIAREILHQTGYGEKFIQEVCEIIKTHHEHLENPSLSFRILYDSDRLVMFSPEEFPHYDTRQGFNWNAVINSMYAEHAKDLARIMLAERKNSLHEKERMLSYDI